MLKIKFHKSIFLIILSRQELIFHTGIFIGRATALKIFLAVAFLLCEIS